MTEVSASTLPAGARVRTVGTRGRPGLRVDVFALRGGLRPVDWFAAPDGVAPDGSVETCGPGTPLSADHGQWRNRIVGCTVLSLRGWDIPHYRPGSLTDLANGRGEIVEAPGPICAAPPRTVTESNAGRAIILRTGAAGRFAIHGKTHRREEIEA